LLKLIQSLYNTHARENFFEELVDSAYFDDVPQFTSIRELSGAFTVCKPITSQEQTITWNNGTGGLSL